ncbi:uncharacterized protein LOC122002894 isoform X1 [Zingiber officinale]|uniref:uncharacterized protein LOC122002894 isoform X1 n=1 Tax=Zingiber officinale TaxID=94328 RepID=UPI001C4B7D5C|nr:uncharacterized protein LOC122002894 isoform X1 [Zingiber officinale]
MPTDDQLSRLIHELCSLLAGLMQAPQPALPPADAPPALMRRPPQRMSPAGFASLLLGASLALMLCGSVTFVIGFMLMPWVIGLVMVFYFAGMLSNLSGMGRAVFCPSSPKEMSGYRHKTKRVQVYLAMNEVSDARPLSKGRPDNNDKAET